MVPSSSRARPQWIGPPSVRRQGIGTALLQALLQRAQAAGKHVLIAGVDSAGAASLKFLERNGFERVGHLREVGYKFGQFLDLVLLQYTLEPAQVDLPPIRK